MLSNLVAFNLDESLSKFANEHGLIYTRYADDITLSSYKKSYTKNERFNIHKNIIQIIRQHDFLVNPKKTRIIGPGARKIVLGLLVDGEVPRNVQEN